MIKKTDEEFFEENKKQLSVVIKDKRSEFDSILRHWDYNSFHIFTVSMTTASLFFICLEGIKNHHWTVIVGGAILSIITLYFAIFFFDAIRDSVGNFVFNNFFVKRTIDDYLKSKKYQDIENLFIEGMTESSRANKSELEDLKLRYCLELFRTDNNYEHLAGYIEKEYKSGRLK